MPAASTPYNRASSPLGVVHPLYRDFQPIWKQLHDIYEGSGGFLDADRPYLVPHPREWLDHSEPVKDDDGAVIGWAPKQRPTNPSPKLRERRKLARYENIAATLIDQLQGALFRNPIVRNFGQNTDTRRPIQDFWDDADGLGTAWDALCKEAWKPAGVFGHVFLYLEEAEDRDVPVVRLYTPLDVPDWLVDDRGGLIAVKFLEAAPRDDFRIAPVVTEKDLRVRLVTAEGWEIQTIGGKRIEGGSHAFDALPVVPLYSRRRALLPVIGQSLLRDPQLYLDHYNLLSEVRELLRKQTFSILNVVVGDTPAGLVTEQQKLGAQAGTSNVLFTSNPAAYISPDSGNVDAYHEHIDRLVRTIYRLALLPWETDSLDAESAEARRMKREDLNQQLAGFADECARADKRVAELVYRARFGEAWARQWEADGLSIQWPNEFDVTPLMDLIDGYTAAIGLDLGETATRAARKKAARATLPDLTQETYAQIDQEIDAMPVKSQEEIRQEEMNAKVAKLTGAMGE